MDKDDIWNQTLSLLLDEVEADDPKTVFLNMLSPLGIFGDQFILIADNVAAESWVRNHYLDEIQETISQISDVSLHVGLSVGNTSKEERDTSQQLNHQSQSHPSQHNFQMGGDMDWGGSEHAPSSISNQSSVHQATTIEDADISERSYRTSHTAGVEALFSKCTFDTFVVGKSNQLARGTAMAVAEQPGIVYNPLFIYGDSGLGKTHLLVAIANYAMQNFPRMVTQYVSANQFLNDYVEATQKNQWGNFNRKYHQVDILLVDDVQYLEGKDETINQLFNIFNEMTNKNKQIVLSADRAPKDIDMDDRMRSRFVSGLLADIKPPDYETRLAILKNYLAYVNQNSSFCGDIPDDVLAYLAKTATSNIREMEGSITRLVGEITYSEKDTISVEEAQDLLEDFFPSAKDKQITIDLIQSEVEKFFGITHADMVSEKRSKNIVKPRHIAIYLSRYMTEESLQTIGRKFGGRDHTTMMYSVRKIEQDQKNDRGLFDQLERLRNIIQERG